MPKKEEKFSFKSILNKFMEKSLQSLISVMAEQSEHLVEWIKNISGLKRKIRMLIVIIVLLSAGLGIFGVGISQYLVNLYPNLGNGLAYILVGIAYILIAVIYVKFSE